MKQHEGDMYNHAFAFHFVVEPITVTVSLFSNFHALWKTSLYAFYFNIDPSFSALKDFFSCVKGNDLGKDSFWYLFVYTPCSDYDPQE